MGASPALLENEHVLELLTSMDRLTGRTSELFDALRGQTVNGVLALNTVVLDAQGTASLDWTVPAGGIALFNDGWGPVVATLEPGPSQSAASSGPGRWAVASGKFVAVPCVARGITLYGRAGEKVTVVATAGTMQPAAGAFRTPAVEAVPLAAGQLFTGVGHYAGFSVRETAGAAAVVTIYDGTSAAGNVLETISLAALGAAGDMGEGPRIKTGVFVALTGTVVGSVRIA